MNRTIKFRGLRLDGRGWAYGNLYQRGFSYYVCENTGHMPLSSEVDPDTIGMFTGLFDDKGKEIYDGDMDCDGNVVAVSFGKYTFNDDRTLSASIEITGNIHEQ